MGTSFRAAATGAHASRARRLLLAATLLTGAGIAPWTARAATPFEGLTPIPADQLVQMRGGFINPSGVVVRFGFETSISVNNQLQQRVVVSPILVAPNVPGVEVTRTNAAGVTTTQQVSMSSLASSPIAFSEIVNGGLTSLSTIFGPNGNLTLVQNRADNTLIQRAATFNFDIAGMRAILAARAANSTMMRGLGTRAIFGR